ncbi:PAS domain-containing hybrid sensor histidine kinase/response regulator [Nodularia sp. NIES-3585]|uniref:PAS domain-containing hybrid sensor histidine kinase/response regulator n=1 Tax=Nodularia sp. NIES-3585 TaxID=1973477 RepID=UPI000B6651F7|nr:multi-sensor hybrid histidine kinase [Nodularia sp. NIES-3585]
MQHPKQIDYHLADQQLDDAPHSNTKIATVEEGMILQLADGSVPACNIMAERILGLTTEEIHQWNAPESSWRFVQKNGTPLTALTHPAMITLRTGKPCWNVVVGLSQSNTDLKWLLMSSQPLFLANETSPYAVVYTFSEITQQQTAEIEKSYADSYIITPDITPNPELQISHKTSDAEIGRQLAENETKFQKVFESNIIGIVLADFEIEAALRESEVLFRQMANTSATLIWMSDTSNLCCYFNQPWLEFRGRTMEQEMGDGWVQGVHPEDVQRCFETYINAFNARQEFKIKYRLKRADGQYRWILDIGTPRFTSEGIFLGYIGSCIDISDVYDELRLRKEVEVEREKMLARSQEYTRQLNGLMEAALAINSALSIEEVIRNITEQAREIIGAHQSFITISIDEDSAKLMSWASLSDKYAAWQVQNQQPFGLSINTSLHLINRSVRMTQTELEAHPQWQQFTQQIDKRPPMRGCLAAPLIGRDGHNMGLIQLSDKYEDEFTKEDQAIIVQLAQMASVAIENTRLYEAEQQARAQAEEANCIKDEFLAVLSHELRSPLNPILGWSKLLQSRKFDASKTASALATIERNAKLQAQLIEDLLDVSRILQGKLTLNVAQVNVGLTIAAAMETVRLAAEAKSINLKFLSDTDSTALVMGDPNRLQQVFWNLLSNAVKFTPPGGRVQVCLESINSNIQIQVMDTGKGIDANFLSHVFDYFRQADSATTRKFGGLGLGLAIVRQLVELHGGRVFADSAGEGEGATFTVQLPALQTQLITADSHSEAEMDSNLGNLEGIKILVVDDDLDSRDFICFVLEEEGAEVISVSSAVEALQTLPKSKADVLLSDIGMPDMDGYMLIRQVRTWTSEEGGKTPAIALTAYAGEYNQQQAISAGFQMHVTKPAEPSQLVAAVARLAGKTVNQF